MREDPRIRWHQKRHPELSDLAIKLALAAVERGFNDHAFEWEERNAKRFQSLLDHHKNSPQTVPNERAT